MDQIQEGRAQFDWLPDKAADLQTFPYIPNILVSAGKLVKTGNKIFLDNPIATVVNSLKNEVVMEAGFYLRLCTLNVYPNGPLRTNSLNNKT